MVLVYKHLSTTRDLFETFKAHRTISTHSVSGSASRMRILPSSNSIAALNAVGFNTRCAARTDRVIKNRPVSSVCACRTSCSFFRILCSKASSSPFSLGENKSSNFMARHCPHVAIYAHRCAAIGLVWCDKRWLDRRARALRRYQRREDLCGLRSHLLRGPPLFPYLF